MSLIGIAITLAAWGMELWIFWQTWQTNSCEIYLNNVVVLVFCIGFGVVSIAGMLERSSRMQLTRGVAFLRQMLVESDSAIAPVAEDQPVSEDLLFENSSFVVRFTNPARPLGSELLLYLFLACFVAFSVGGLFLLIDITSPSTQNVRVVLSILLLVTFLTLGSVLLLFIWIARLCQSQQLVADERELHALPGNAASIAWNEARAFFIHESESATFYGLDTGTKLIIWSHKSRKQDENQAQLLQIITTRTSLPLRDITESACAIGGISSFRRDVVKALTLDLNLEQLLTPNPDARLTPFRPLNPRWKYMTRGAKLWFGIICLDMLFTVATYLDFRVHL